MSKIKQRLKMLYPTEHDQVYCRIQELTGRWKERITASYAWVGKEDVMMITYGDGIHRTGEAPLKTLKEFLDTELKGIINAVHLLPMFPYTSDDGFSVSDFRSINTELGDWEDIEALKENYDLMFDAVINHVSASSSYFQEFLKGNKSYQKFFLVCDPKGDYSKVTRPRALPLLTAFDTAEGKKHVWTTFSEDQIDLNYKDPAVLLEILDILLFYAWKGARFLRFDAIGFAWKENGTTCMHLPKTHELVRLMREVLEECVKGITIITETNVPHEDNISYFGNGFDEAGLVYQFPLPPLTLHSYISGSAIRLSDWAASLKPTTEATTYFNFLASHDGIGMRPVEDLLTEEERKNMVDTVLARGGEIGLRNLPDGSTAPYELNINYLDAIAGNETDREVMVQKFMGAQCILLSMAGVPGIYYHSLLGSRNCRKEFEESGIKRRINREKLDLDVIKTELSEDTLRRRVIERYKALISVRKTQDAFVPNRSQQVIRTDDRLFTLIRGGESDQILVVVNVSDQPVEVSLPYKGTELLSKTVVDGTWTAEPYGYYWVKLENEEESV